MRHRVRQLPRVSAEHGCQMAIAKILDRMCLALRASGLWLRYAMLQNLIPSFPWIAPGWRASGRNERKGSNFAIWPPWCRAAFFGMAKCVIDEERKRTRSEGKGSILHPAASRSVELHKLSRGGDGMIAQGPKVGEELCATSLSSSAVEQSQALLSSKY